MSSASTRNASRLPLLPTDLQEPADVVAAIRHRRKGQLGELDRLLLHSPPFAAGWNTFLGAVRQQLSLKPWWSELAICAVATLNGADYEFVHHASEFQKLGATQEQVEALRDPAGALQSPLFDAGDQAVLRLTMEMTRSVAVADATFEALRGHLNSDQELVELVGTVAAYNMVSRFLVALQLLP